MSPTLMAALATLGQVNEAFTSNLSFQFSNLPGHRYSIGVASYFLTLLFLSSHHYATSNVRAIALSVEDLLVDLETPPDRGRTICLEFFFLDAAKSVKIPFTEIALALACALARIALDRSKYLQPELSTVSTAIATLASIYTGINFIHNLLKGNRFQNREQVDRFCQ
jgi:hypothetical protein